MARKLLMLIVLLAPAYRALAVEELRVAVTRTSEKIQVDGALTEAVWRSAPSISGFTQVEPREGEPPTEQTYVWLATDGGALYVAVRCFDHSPALVATEMSRDSSLYNNDNVEIIVDTYHDHRNAYYFATNPSGVFVDGRVTENQRPSTEWDGIWNVRSAIDEQGWTAEFEIPFETIGFNPNVAEWGFNIQRFMVRGRESSRWASPSLDSRLNQVTDAGHITGLEELRQGVGLDIKPYVIGGFNRDIERIDQVWGTRDGGMDMFYRITSNIVSATTFNTDFAETESDSRQVNLSRFPTFFPEKRAFFLEDAGVFEFARNSGTSGSRGGDLMPFFSRSIGLLDGEEVPIRVGEKMTGKIGRFDFGILDAQTGALEDELGNRIIAGRNLAVGRVKANFLSQSYLGAIFTNGDPSGQTANQVGGVDFKLATSNFLNRGKNLSFMAFGSKAWTPGVQSRDVSYGGEIAYPNDTLNLQYKWLKIGENYDPALGFVPRKDVRISSGSAEVRLRPGSGAVRRITHSIRFSDYYDMSSHAVESQDLRLVPIELSFNSGDSLSYNLRFNREGIFEPWEISDGIFIPTSRYSYHTHSVRFLTSASRPVSISLDGATGSFYSGTRRELTTDLSWRKNRHLSTSIRLEQNWVNLKEGSFSTKLLMYRFDYAFTPLITLTNFIQYDTESQNIGLQSRFRWTMKPGNDVFMVLNHSWEETTFDRFEAIQTRFRVKFNYTFRF